MLEEILKLYPDYDSVLGPYTRPDKRMHIVLNKTKQPHKLGKLKTISYPKALMEIKLKRRLLDNETVDHIDEDKTNNDIDNLQVLTRRENIEKAFQNGTYENFYAAARRPKSAEHKRKISKALKNKRA